MIDLIKMIIRSLNPIKNGRFQIFRFSNGVTMVCVAKDEDVDNLFKNLESKP